MCNCPGRFHCKSKIGRTRIIPLFQCCQLREAVKSDIQLKRMEMFTVIAKPLALRQLLRIESSFPMFIVKARAADMPVYHDFSCRTSEFFIGLLCCSKTTEVFTCTWKSSSPKCLHLPQKQGKLSKIPNLS